VAVSEQEQSLQKTRRQVRRRKACLLALVVVTALAPLVFLSLDEPTFSLQLYKLLAKTGSLAGTTLLVWQMLLGFRGFVARIVSDLLWVLGLHKQVGKYGALLILLHPIFITAYYAEKYGYNLLEADFSTTFGTFVAVGMGGLAILAAIVLTSLLRRRINYRFWYTVHLTSYAMVPAVLIHGLAIGSTIRSGALGYFWVALCGLVGILWICRALARLGMGTHRFRVTRVRRVADNTTEITMTPERPRDRIAPQVGQFAYVRPGWGGYARPFTLSRYDEASGSVAITVKALGHTSDRLQRTTVGETLHIDGPYGVFGQEAIATDRQVVMIAGGIGITPFVRLAEYLAHEAPRRKPVLFYAAASRAAMAYGDELSSMPHLMFVPLAADERRTHDKRKLITVDHLKQHLEVPLGDCEFLLCGPPAMIRGLERALRAAGVARRRIHHELFVF